MQEQHDLYSAFIEVYSSLFRLREEGSMRPQVNVQELIDSYRKLFSLHLTTVFPELVTLDLSVVQFNVFLWLDSRRASTVGDVANQFGMTLPVASHLIDSLVQVGLAVRLEDSGDWRRTYVELTGQGKALAESLLGGLQQRAVVLFQELDEDDQGALVQGFQAIIRVLSKESNST